MLSHVNRCTEKGICGELSVVSNLRLMISDKLLKSQTYCHEKQTDELLLDELTLSCKSFENSEYVLL